MAMYQVCFDSAPENIVTVQSLGDAPPAGSTKIHEFEHSNVDDLIGAEVSHVLWHHIRDGLYKIGVLTTQYVTVNRDIDYVALTGIAITPGVVSIAVAATSQLGITKTPANASNGAVTWVSSDPTKATVSETGLVTGVAAGTTTITATSVDGGKTATREVTVTA